MLIRHDDLDAARTRLDLLDDAGARRVLERELAPRVRQHIRWGSAACWSSCSPSR
ncbi:MAG: hypothetical protein WKG01_17490 [Kofleriaceae bacterium]